MSLRLVIPVLLLVATGCVPDDVVADVGGRRLTIGDVRAAAKLEQAQPLDAVLEGLVAKERLAAEAVRRKLNERDDVKARLKAAEREILAQMLLDEATGTVDEKALRAKYDSSDTMGVRQVELAHIYFAKPSGNEPELLRQAQSRATAAWARLLGGDAFELVARETSEDTITAGKGGALGIVREGALAQELFVAAAELDEGAYTRPVQTPFGFHILKALKKASTVKLSWDEARGRLAIEGREAAKAALMKQVDADVRVRRYEKALARLSGEVAR